MNESINSWEKTLENKAISIYRRPVPETSSFLIKAISIIDDVSHSDVFTAIYDSKKRMEWDHVFKEFKIILPQTDDRNEIIYMSVKSPSILVSDRDFVQQRKVWKNFNSSNSNIIHFKSVDCPECPVRKNHVRAHTTISGYYVETISTTPLKTKLIIVSQNDIKGYIPKVIVNKAVATAPKQWVENLIKGCKK